MTRTARAPRGPGAWREHALTKIGEQRFVDQRAQTVLDDIGRTAPDRGQPDAPGEAVPVAS